MTGSLRFAGILIAALWFGAVGFHTLVAVPALNSVAAQSLYGPKFFPYFSTATAQVLTAWYFHLGTTCAFLAVAHLLIENLYLGRRMGRFALWLLLTLFALNLLGSAWLNPKLITLHRAQHALNTPMSAREAAAQSFRTWQGVFQAVNVLLLVGVTANLWRVSHQADIPRFLGSGKFRG